MWILVVVLALLSAVALAAAIKLCPGLDAPNDAAQRASWQMRWVLTILCGIGALVTGLWSIQAMFVAQLMGRFQFRPPGW